MNTQFGDRLCAAIIDKKTPLVVGLDPRAQRLPNSMRPGVGASPAELAAAFRQFCHEIIDVVAPLVPAVKPQAAFFEQLGPPGMLALKETIDHAQAAGLLVIMDAKRGDIGSTAEAYAAAFLGSDSPWGCDALTVNPYLGDDSLVPFVDRAKATESGIFVLVKTSNPGSRTLQELTSDSETIYSIVGRHVQSLNQDQACQYGYGCIGAVVGATFPQQLAELRQLMPNSILLIPGLGAQGGTAADVAGGFDEQGLGAVVNSSRAIIFAYDREPYRANANWQQAVEQATRDTISQLATETTAGKLGAS